MRPSTPKSPSTPGLILRNTAVRKGIFAGIAGLSLAGTVAGCAPSTADSGPGAAGNPAAPTSGSSTLAGSGASYKDGTYSADGNYVSPNGTETVGVQLTLDHPAPVQSKHPQVPGPIRRGHRCPGGG